MWSLLINELTRDRAVKGISASVFAAALYLDRLQLPVGSRVNVVPPAGQRLSTGWE
jgi:hypothetical protein